MEHKRFGLTDLKVAPIGFGCARVGGISCSGPGRKRIVYLLHEALERGINTYDTADAYAHGDSEKLLGEAFQARRDQVVIATKGGYCFSEQTLGSSLFHPLVGVARRVQRQVRTRLLGAPGQFSKQDFSSRYLIRAVEDSLRRLRTTYIDLYQLHAPRAAQATDTGLLETLQGLRKSGKIRYFGVGLESLDDAQLWLEAPGLASIQIPFGVVDPEANAVLLAKASKQRIAVIARGVFAGGLLKNSSQDPPLPPAKMSRIQSLHRIADGSKRSLHELALRYVLQKPEIAMALIGMRRLAHLEANLRWAEAPPLSADTIQAIEQAA